MKRKRELELALEEATAVLYDFAWHMPIQDDRHYGLLTAANNAHLVLGGKIRPLSVLAVRPRP